MALEKSFKYSFRRRHARRLSYIYDLLHELVGRDIKIQYKRSVMGIAWSFITPLMQLVVYYFIFRLALSFDIPNYATFIFTGMLVWTWFQMSLFRGATAITESRELIRQPGFPVPVLPVVAVVTNLVHFSLSLPILFLFLSFGHGNWLTPSLVFLPGLVVLQFIFTLSLTYLVAALNVPFRDTQHILGVLLNLFFYLTPIFYDIKTIPDRYLSIYYLNPMTHIIEAYRAILLYGELPDWSALVGLAVISIGMLFFTYRIFRQASYRFAEEL
jgi:lipopolysaccharide transport system permease protein